MSRWNKKWLRQKRTDWATEGLIQEVKEGSCILYDQPLASFHTNWCCITLLSHLNKCDTYYNQCPELWIYLFVGDTSETHVLPVAKALCTVFNQMDLWHKNYKAATNANSYIVRHQLKQLISWKATEQDIKLRRSKLTCLELLKYFILNLNTLLKTQPAPLFEEDPCLLYSVHVGMYNFEMLEVCWMFMYTCLP